MNKSIKYILAFLLISLIGIAIYFFLIKSVNKTDSHVENEIYTCSMHPQIRENKPGNCPICGMTLIKVITEDHQKAENSIDNLLQPTDNFVVGNYETTTATDTIIYTQITLPGVVEYDPSSAVNIAARVDGRIEKMYVHYKFQKVTKGQKLFDLYSPELLTEQQNYIYLLSNDKENESLAAASKQKLVLYGMTPAQIKTIANTKKTNPVTSIYSPASGIIQGAEEMTKSTNGNMQSQPTSTEILNIKEGDYIKKNTVVFTLLNTTKVWAVFNVLQEYATLIKLNQPVKISTELNLSEQINAKINFIETQFNTAEKSNRIRVYLNNNKLKLPIGLRLQGMLWSNPVKALWLQKQALVSIGTNKIVFIKMNNGFKAKEITTGIEMNNYVQITGGITQEDTIAANAQYLIDSESFIKQR